MSERRYNAIEKYEVLIAPERGLRPNDFNQNKPTTQCPFCPGNENVTPPESYRLKDNVGNWTIRSFPNKYPAFLQNEKDVAGYQEVIVDSTEHHFSIGDYSRQHFTDLLSVFQKRVVFLKKKQNLKYIVIFKNHGEQAGASLTHPHTQITGLNAIPDAVLKRTEALQEYYKTHKACYLCSCKKNVVFENENFTAFISETARFAYQTHVIPKKHTAYFEQCNTKKLEYLAEIVLKVIKAINHVLNNPAFNLMIHTGFDEKHDQAFHWSLEIIPRTSYVAGFEMATGFFINQADPAQSANKLKQQA